MTYREAVARLLALRGGEVQGMRPGLERIHALLEALGHPEDRFRIAQVGGTNGKGSIAAMLAAMLEAGGRRTGLYTSPHLVSFRERIRVDGACIPPEDVVDGVEALGTLVARLDCAMFEAATALALDHFAQSGVEVAVLEVGLGGRFDATTVGRPEVVALGPIDRDHEALLGSRIETIAWEKAGIVRSGVAVTARQHPAAAEVLAREAARAGVPLLREGAELAVAVRESTLAGHRLDVSGPGWRMEDLRCPLLGLYQPSNALLAAAAARALGVDEGAIRSGLARARWPGRFQVLEGDPPLVLDGAHNPAGAAALAASIRHYFPGRRVTLVVGAMADKDTRGILEALVPLAERLVLTAVDHPRAASPESLLEKVPARGAGIREGVTLTRTVDDAIRLARQAGEARPVVVAGSLYVVGRVLANRPEVLDFLCQPEPRC